MTDEVSGELQPARALRFLEDRCHAGLFSWKLDGDVMRWSSGFYALLGLPSGGSERASVSLLESLLHPHDRPAIAEFRASAAEGAPFARRVQILLRDGRTRWVDLFVEYLFDHEGNPTQMVGIATDVTRDMSESVRRRQDHDRIGAAVGSIAAVTWVADAYGSFIEHTGFEWLTGRQSADGLADRWLSAVHPDDRASASSKWRNAVAAGERFAHVFRLASADGKYHTVQYIGVASTMANGTVVGWNGLGIDLGVDHGHLTGAQIRAARGTLNWSLSELGRRADVSTAVIRRLERIDGVAAHAERAVQAIRVALTSAGVEFTTSNDGTCGIAMRVASERPRPSSIST